MRIHLPRKTSKDRHPKPLYGVLRDVSHFRNLWQIKISVPKLSNIDNLYLSLDDEEMNMIKEELERVEGSEK